MDENSAGKLDGDYFLFDSCLSCFIFTSNVANENLKFTHDLCLNAFLDIATSKNRCLDDYASTKRCR